MLLCRLAALIIHTLILLMECKISEDWPTDHAYRHETSNTILASVSVSLGIGQVYNCENFYICTDHIGC